MSNNTLPLKRCAVVWFILVLFATLPTSARAQTGTTGCLEIGGNLDSGTVTTAPPAGNPVSFAALTSTANFSTFLDIRDSLRTLHTVTVYFFKTASDSWEVRFYVDASELTGGQTGAGLIGISSLTFLPDGSRSTSPDVDATLTPSWANGSSLVPITVRMQPFTQFHTSSSITNVSSGCDVSPPTTDPTLDFDGNGADDVVVYRPEFGMWYIRDLSTNSTLVRQWGLSQDTPIAGDYDGDLKPDLAVWRPSNGNWYICRSSDGYDCSKGTVQQFGLPGDRPIRADYDGDGKLDLAIWRPSNRQFYYKSSSTGLTITVQWGLTGDVPVTAGVSSSMLQ